MEVPGKLCPFRSTDQVVVYCQSICQLFIPGRPPQQGTCALAALPSVPTVIISLERSLNEVVRAIGAKHAPGPR